MILLSLALFRATQITGFITFINASLSHVGQCTATERDAKHSKLRVFLNLGANIFFICRPSFICRTILIVWGGYMLSWRYYITWLLNTPGRRPVLSYVHSTERGDILDYYFLQTADKEEQKNLLDTKVFEVPSELQQLNKAINAHVPYTSNMQMIEGNSIDELQILINFTKTLLLAVRHHGSS
jgi:hypothetical protein